MPFTGKEIQTLQIKMLEQQYWMRLDKLLEQGSCFSQNFVNFNKTNHHIIIKANMHPHHPKKN